MSRTASALAFLALVFAVAVPARRALGTPWLVGSMLRPIAPLPMPAPLAERLASPFAPRPRASHDRAVLVSIDGLRADAAAGVAFDRLRREGSFAPKAETIPRSTTLPSHVSMTTGVRAERHGIRFNFDRTGPSGPRVPTVFSAARRAGLPTALFVAKPKLVHLIGAAAGTSFTVTGHRCDAVNAAALPYLTQERRGLTFVHYADPDSAGHRSGWQTDDYSRAVARVDVCLGALLDAVSASDPDGRTIVVVTADHGGHARTHGSTRAEDVRIPWFVWGGGIAGGTTLRGAVQTLDTTPTLLRALGLPSETTLDGRSRLDARGHVDAERTFDESRGVGAEHTAARSSSARAGATASAR